MEERLIKQPVFLFISGILFLVFGYFLYDRIGLLLNAERTIGNVQNISATNARCGGGKRRSKYPCTKFSALVSYKTNSGIPSDLSVGAGSARGHNQTVNYASRRIGEAVKVIYDTRNIKVAYEDSILSVWGAPIMTFIFQIATLFGSMTNSRKRGY